MVMQPKSIATVVVCLVSTPDRSSTPTPRLVNVSSVRSGSISETVPTRVVLPAPKPPATRILIALGSLTCPASRLECAESIEHRPVQALVVHVRLRMRFLQGDESLVQQVAEQDTDGASRKVHVRGDLRYRLGLTAEPD